MAKKNRVIAFIVAILFFAVIFFSSSYIILHHNHHCHDEHCDICYQIDVCQHNLKQLVFTGVSTQIFVSSIVFLIYIVRFIRNKTSSNTLITLKVKLSN